MLAACWLLLAEYNKNEVDPLKYTSATLHNQTDRPTQPVRQRQTNTYDRHRHADIKRHTHTDTGIDTDQQTNRHTDGHTDRQADR